MTITFKDLATLPIPDLLQRMLSGEEIECHYFKDKYSWQQTNEGILQE